MLTLHASALDIVWRHRSGRSASWLAAPAHCGWEQVDIGCLSCTRGFQLLPLVLALRLKSIFTAFFSLGCALEGEQKALGETWFVMYPSLVEFLFFYFSDLNWLAKWRQRRITDVWFGPTLLLFGVLHHQRIHLVQSGWLKEIDGRIPTAFSAAEYEQLRVIDFFTTNAALRVNGNVPSLFALKLVVLALNLLPLALPRRVIERHRTEPSAASVTTTPCRIEDVLAFRATWSGGLGRSSAMYLSVVEEVHSGHRSASHVLNSYELLRLGYVVLGDAYLIAIAEWFYFLLVPSMGRGRVSTYPVELFHVRATRHGYEVAGTMEYCRLSDPKLRDVHFWQLRTVAFK
ncbi:hypothetical protein FI667_g9178, partial [Globisporangium splendens]